MEGERQDCSLRQKKKDSKANLGLQAIQGSSRLDTLGSHCSKDLANAYPADPYNKYRDLGVATDFA